MTTPRERSFVQPVQGTLPWARVMVGLLLCLLGLSAHSSDTTKPAPAPRVFRVGMSQVCFRNVNRNDAKAAYRVFLENSGRRFGHIFRAEPEVFDDTLTFEAALQQTPMQLAVMDAWQFLTMDIHGIMKPYFSVMENGKVGRKYLILIRRDSGFKTLADLRGKAMVELETASANVAKVWLDTRLLSEKLGTQRTFFDSVQVVAKPSAAVLPVFFGAKPACLVDESSFNVMKELNPQVGQALEAVAVSDTLADVVVCLREDDWKPEQFKSDTLQSLTELHLDPIGQQICTLFKVDRMVPFQETQLDTIRKLRAEYELLRKGDLP